MSDDPRVETVAEPYGDLPSPAQQFEMRDRQLAEYERRGQAAYAAVTDPHVLAVLDVLAPVSYGRRSPILQWPKKKTPEAAEMIEIATKVVAAMKRVSDRSSGE